MTTLLIGANGQLGSELRQVFKDDDMVPPTHAALEAVDRIQEMRFPIMLQLARYGQPHPI